jgi:hypothetical protein
MGADFGNGRYWSIVHDVNKSNNIKIHSKENPEGRLREFKTFEEMYKALQDIAETS